MQITPQDQDSLRKLLIHLDGRHVGSYSELMGEYNFGDFSLIIDFIPEDPSKQPARLRARVALETAKFPRDVFNTLSREIGARDFIARAFAAAAARSLNATGLKKGPRLYIDRPGVEILETSAVAVGNGFIEARFSADLPVRRDKIQGGQAIDLIMNVLPGVVRDCLFFRNIDGDGLADWIEANEDADTARSMLDNLGLAAFVADGSVLTGKALREQKLSDLALVRFVAPEDLAVTLELPNRGQTRGMGIPKGITLIAGAGGQGKTTLLRALEHGVYNHVPGDGRELVVSRGDAVGNRAEEGRHIENVDISTFFSSYDRMDSKHYSTRSASTSASQAANFMEALEIGTSLFIIDEDTSAAELMDRDARMQALVSRNRETVTTFVDILPAVRDKLGISVIITATPGDYLEIADTVILMDGFQAVYGLEAVRRIIQEHPSGRVPDLKKPPSIPVRTPLSHSLEPEKLLPQDRVRPYMRGQIQYGGEFIDCGRVTQLAGVAQGRAISRAISLVHRFMDSSNSLREAIERVMERVESVGLDTLSGRLMGDLARFRAYELAAAINRIKRLKVK